MLCSFLTILLITMDNIGMEAAPYATLSPFFHIPLDPGGLTILVCVVSDVLNRDGGMSWLSRSTSRSRPVIYNVLGEEDSTENTVSVHSLVSTEWATYTCFVSHRSTIRFMHRDYGGFQKRRTDLDDEEMEDMCSEHQSDFTKDIRFHTDLLIIQALRIILLKITVFNVLMTTHAVIKWEPRKKSITVINSACNKCMNQFLCVTLRMSCSDDNLDEIMFKDEQQMTQLTWM